MKEQIHTIPISDAFDNAGECPFCYIEKRTEDLRSHGPLVKRSKTSPFHGENMGSNPVGVTIRKGPVAYATGPFVVRCSWLVISKVLTSY